MNIKNFGWALLFSFTASNLFIIDNTYAVLEPINSKDQKFSAWCNFPKNKCKFTINNGRLIIDKHLGGKGILFNDIFSYEKFEEEHQLSNYRKKPDLVWVHQFEYQKSDGSFSTTKIMFKNKKSDNRFSAAIDSSI
tara:strand:- start:2128 stop:2535 length:408 start_codon:yes stop_codon:yes gene_type:complete